MPRGSTEPTSFSYTNPNHFIPKEPTVRASIFHLHRPKTGKQIRGGAPEPITMSLTLFPLPCLASLHGHHNEGCPPYFPSLDASQYILQLPHLILHRCWPFVSRDLRVENIYFFCELFLPHWQAAKASEYTAMLFLRLLYSWAAAGRRPLCW